MLHPSLGDLPREERSRLDAYFHSNVFPVLTPLAVDPGHPFPYISNLSLSLAVVLRGADGEERFARVKVPKILPRWVPLLSPNEFVPLEEVIGANLESLFPGVEILGCYTFRITRNTDLQIDDDDEADDLLSLIQEEVRNRRFAEVVRIEVHTSMPASLRQLLLAEFSEQQEPPARPLTARRPLRGAGTAGRGRPAVAGVAGPARAQGSAVPPGHPAPPRGGAQHLRRDPRRRHPSAPPVRQLRHLGRALHPDRGGRSRRPRHQAHALPHRRRLEHRPGAGARRRARQAGGGADRAAGEVRRGEQHHLGAAAGRRGRPRELRRRGTQDPLQGGAGGPPRGRHDAPLRPHRHRQLQPEDRPDLRRLRAPHREPRPRRRPHRPVQRAHRLRLPVGLPEADRGAARHARAVSRHDPSGDRAPPRRAPGADHREDERAGGSRDHRRALPGLAGGRADRPDRAGHLLPPSGPAGHQRNHHG